MVDIILINICFYFIFLNDIRFFLENKVIIINVNMDKVILI